MLVNRAIIAIAIGEAFIITILHFKAVNRVKINLLDLVVVCLFTINIVFCSNETLQNINNYRFTIVFVEILNNYTT